MAHQAPAFEIQGTIISRLRRPIRLEPSRSHSAHRALWDREGGECWPVRPRMIYVPWTKRAPGRNIGHTLHGLLSVLAPMAASRGFAHVAAIWSATLTTPIPMFFVWTAWTLKTHTSSDETKHTL